MGLLLKIFLLINLLDLMNCGICFPGEACPTTTAKPRNPSKLRARLRQECFGKDSSNNIFYGECRFKKRGCRNKESSKSRKCGKRLVCCNIPRPVEQVETTTTTTTTTSTTTTTTTTTNPTSTRDNLGPIINPNPFESLNDPNCGIAFPTGQILGGIDAGEGEFPFMVSFVQKTDGELENFCGGVLITQRHVLSAAHCFDRYSLSTWRNSKVIDVRIGIVNIQDRELSGARANIKDIDSHPGFKRRTAGSINPIHDIAIVTLTRSIESEQVGRACLPTAFTRDQSRPDKNSNKLSTLLGWGSNSTSTTDSVDILQKAYTPVIPAEECQEKYTDWLGEKYHVDIKSDGMMCAGDKVIDTCPGDSGSPMLWRDDQSRMAVAGIVSFGPSGCGSGIPGVFTKVERYLKWIKMVIKRTQK